MGVPGFFAWLLKNYKNEVIVSKIDKEVDYLYLDTNCLAHPKSFEVIDSLTKKMDNEQIIELMFKKIIEYIDFLYNYVKPRELLYISIDGVAPMAKINQQRKRRYKSLIDNMIKNDIKKKHKKKIFTDWNNSVITPGTEFMELLHDEILKYTMSNDKIKIIYSSYHTPGEGEHKILEHIRLNMNDKIYVIYGLDADLIFLALASKKNNLYLLRETQHFGELVKHNDGFHYVAMDELRICLNEKLTGNNEEIEIDLTDDFIFICYFLGNDFLPHLPSVDIKTGGLDIIVKNYNKIRNKLNETMVDVKKKDKINMKFLRLFLESMSTCEDYYFRQVLPAAKDHWGNKIKHLDNMDDEYEKEVWKFENLLDIELNDEIRLGQGGKSEYKYRYYNEYFNCSDYMSDIAGHAAYEYFVGIKWVTEYYFVGCPSWTWQYPYSHAPFMTDLGQYVCDVNEIILKIFEPITPFMQLLMVIPPSYRDILPKSYQILMYDDESPIIDYFPTKIFIDFINKEMNWKGVPILSIIDIDRIKRATLKLKLTKKEQERNNTCDDIMNK